MHASTAVLLGSLSALVLASGCNADPGSTDSNATEITTASDTSHGSSTTQPGSTTQPSSTSGAGSESGTGDSTLSTGMPPEFCGDGIVQDDEQCDEGQANSDNAACTSACVSNICGDGHLLEDVEECDEAEDNADNSTCTSACTVNVCGDGYLQDGVEECDEAEANSDNAGCTDSCTKNICGDGFLYEGHEECDDIDTQFSGGGDGCSEKCTHEVVFFPSIKRVTGDFGGRAGADEICRIAGKESIKMPWPMDNNTIFRAWVADPTCPVTHRFPHTDLPYVRLDGKVIAKDWDDFVNGLSSGDASMNEYGLVINKDFVLRAWTGLDGNGSKISNAASATCNYWTLEGDAFFGAVGRVDLGGKSWSQWTSGGQPVTQGCHKEAHIYCMQINCDLYPNYCQPNYCAP